MRRVRRCALVLLMGSPLSLSSAMQPPDGRRFRIARDTIVDGVRCAATGRVSAVVHANGALDECPISADTVIAGLALPKGTWLRVSDARVLVGAWLLADTPLQGLPCKGTGYKGWAVRFHPTGSLAMCYLSRETTVDGVPCRSAAFMTELRGNTQVTLHPNGRLHSCRVTQAVTRDGVTTTRGDRVDFDENGHTRTP